MREYKPQGYTDVTPWIISQDTAGLMDFLNRAFGAEELSRLADEDGVIGHAEMRIGDAIVMMFDMPDWPKMPAFLRLYVEDAEKVFNRAVAAGAMPVTRVTHLAFGDRVGRVRDAYGNIYWIQTRIEDVSEEEMNRRWTDPEWAARMAYVQMSLENGLQP
ncbi:VOC family protein [Pelagibacterium limicola]|uniref:VOC family protein n=1 Tax=Pelagibacterium limicola TaxID=2791022 RepID=UPI0018AF6931|nr:VOC family protein [Pelagibacterium limicola]